MRLFGICTLLAASLLLLSAAFGEDKPQLPSGHPAIGGPTSMPAGHPAIGGMSGMPAGHPNMGGMSGMPAGHPNFGGMGASTRPAVAGTITIHAVQGTKDGPAIGGEDVVLELYLRDQVLSRFTAKLDDKGTAVIKDVPVIMPVEPAVRVRHAGVDFEAVGQALDQEHASQQIEVKVFETTEEAPAWKVQMRHVMIQKFKEGIGVFEMISVENPADRAWLGIKGADGKRASVALQFPTNAEEMMLDETTTRTPDGRLLYNGPLVPGTTRFQFRYLITSKTDEYRFAIKESTDVDQMMMIIPDDGSTVKVEGLKAAGVQEMGKRKAALFKGDALKAGHEMVLTLTQPKKKDGAGPVGLTNQTPKIIAGVGGGIVVVCGAAYVFFRGGKAMKQEPVKG